MPLHTNDNDLRPLFAAMRDEDIRHAPPFDPFWDETVARADAPRRRGVWMRYAAAAALLIGAVLSAFLLLQPREAMSITEWQSPTASLLAPSALSLEHYVPPTQSLWPSDTLQSDTSSYDEDHP